MPPEATERNFSRVWMVNHHAALPSKDGQEGRHLALARHLPKHGWHASLIVASTTHPSGRQRLKGLRFRKLTTEAEVPVVWVKTTTYRSMAQRLMGMCVFSAGVLLPGTTRGIGRPDVVIGSTVHLLAAWAGLRLARRHRVPFVFEIRDVWPETLVDLGQLSEGGWAARSMAGLSHHLARRASMVISPLPHIDRYLTDARIPDTPFLWIPNGVEVEPESAPVFVPHRDDFTFMYLGAHGMANGLPALLRGFDLATSMRPDLAISFRLVGDGPLKDELQSLAQSLPSAARIQFEERIPQSQVRERAREADCLVVNVLDKPVYRFGLGLNKFYSYMSSYRPVLVATDRPTPISEVEAGIAVPPDDVPAIARAMVRMALLSPDDRTAMAERGYSHVRSAYGYEGLSARLAEALDLVATHAQDKAPARATRSAGRQVGEAQ